MLRSLKALLCTINKTYSTLSKISVDISLKNSEIKSIPILVYLGFFLSMYTHYVYATKQFHVGLVGFSIEEILERDFATIVS